MKRRKKKRKYYLEDNFNSEIKFPLDSLGCVSVIKYIKKLSHYYDINLDHIIDLVKKFVQRGHRMMLYDKDFYVFELYRPLFKVKKFDYYITEEFERNGYFIKYSRQKKSPSIYITNDNLERVRISDHYTHKYYKNRLISKKWSVNLHKRNRLFTKEELAEVGINNLKDGLYLLEYYG